MKKNTLLYFLLISFSAISQNNLWPSDPINTGSNATYVLGTDADVTFNGQEFIYGKLGAFYTDNNSELQNGGWILWNNASNNFAVMGDDSTTPEKDGFAQGEEIIWLATNDNGTTTYQATVEYTMGPGGMGTNFYSANSINILSEFTITNTVYCVNDADGDGICDESVILGCTDITATNFNINATDDDGSCLYYSVNNGSTSCENGEVGVFVSMQYTDINVPAGEVSWDIQDSNGDTLQDFDYLPIGSNFLYESDEICLPEGEIYTFNTYDTGGDGWGFGSWYELSICGGNSPVINNSGNAPTGDGGSESFSLPFVTDNCFCFSLDLQQSNASSPTAADGSINSVSFAGNPPFAYEWSNGATTENLNNVAPGIYFVTITDSLGCELTEMAEVQGPNIYMGPGTNNLCTGYFYDSGGPNGNFDANENYVYTICSDAPDLSSAISFYSFDLTGSVWSWPSITIYDGETTVSPILYSYAGPGDLPPGNIVATDDNESGCLTISFNSGNNVSYGWFAEINCFSDEDIFGCTDQTACNFDVMATYDDGSCSLADLYYNCDGTCFNDSDGDGVCNELEYFGCTDPNACNFNDDAVYDDGSCEIPTTNFTGNSGDPIYIPDGSGVSYETTLNIQAFDAEAILDDNDFMQICIEMEHSYLGDLQLELSSPNGSTVILHSYGSGGASTWLGNALDADATATPGECWEYCWSSDAEFGTFGNSLGNTIIAPNGSPAMAPGSYSPEGDFSNFEGSSANGVWTLTITDNLAIDNGFICAWGLSMLDMSLINCEEILGCTDSTASNYNPEATVDGSCNYDTQTQTTFDCNDNADQLISYLVSEVEFSNATVSGFDCSVGTFNGMGSSIALESGLVMATNGVESIIPGNLGFGIGGGAGVDADLTLQLEMVNATATNLNNLIILEFDFIPQFSSILFQYVFASNEYPGYTCSQFNDIFGFFLSGPGINGPFSNNAINIARVPINEDQTSFTDSPVIINTINSGTPSSGDSTPCDVIDPNWEDYSVFYTNNSNLQGVNFPGFTAPLTATSNVIPGETYHIKLAIADVSDGALNSAVFLLENSFLSEVVLGCTNPLACNYNVYANLENGSCLYGAENAFLSSIINEYDLSSYDYYTFFEQGTSTLNSSSIFIQGTNLFSQGTNLLFNTSTSLLELIEENLISLFNYFDDNSELYDCYDCINDVDGNGICDELEEVECNDPNACNYNPNAINNNEYCEYYTIIEQWYINGVPQFDATGSPIFIEVEYPDIPCNNITGCTDSTACNFNIDATEDDGSCITDTNGDGICNDYEVNDLLHFFPPTESTYNIDSTQITLPNAYLEQIYNEAINVYVGNYVPFELDEYGTILCPINYFEISNFSLPNGIEYNCSPSNCNFQQNSTGEINLYGTPSETGFYELILSANASVDLTPLGLAFDIEFSIPYYGGNPLLDLALNGDYSIINNVVPQFFINVEPQGNNTDEYGCTDIDACNYNSLAVIDNGTCQYPEQYYNCDGSCINDSDGDGIPDELEIVGCTDPNACNYNLLATDEGSCQYPEQYYNCEGSCINDNDQDGICDELDCIYENEFYDFDVNFINVTITPNIYSIFNVYANINLSDFIITVGDLIGAFYTIGGTLVNVGYVTYDGTNPMELVVSSDDPLTDGIEGFQEGQNMIWIVQQSETGNNYLIQDVNGEETFTPNIETVVFLESINQTCTLGCTDDLACNFNIAANIEDGNCQYILDNSVDCDGNCINDLDLDEICDEIDNCLEDFNPDQIDSDNDGDGNACDYDDGIGIDEITNHTPTLIKMVDVLGREQQDHNKGSLLFYIYDNGVVEKKIMH